MRGIFSCILLFVTFCKLHAIENSDDDYEEPTEEDLILKHAKRWSRYPLIPLPPMRETIEQSEEYISLKEREDMPNTGKFCLLQRQILDSTIDDGYLDERFIFHLQNGIEKEQQDQKSFIHHRNSMLRSMERGLESVAFEVSVYLASLFNVTDQRIVEQISDFMSNDLKRNDPCYESTVMSGPATVIIYNCSTADVSNGTSLDQLRHLYKRNAPFAKGFLAYLYAKLGWKGMTFYSTTMTSVFFNSIEIWELESDLVEKICLFYGIMQALNDVESTRLIYSVEFLVNVLNNMDAEYYDEWVLRYSYAADKEYVKRLPQ